MSDANSPDTHRANFKFSKEQIEAIIDKVTPLIAVPGNEEWIRGVLHCVASTQSSAGFGYFVARLLASTDHKPEEPKS